MAVDGPYLQLNTCKSGALHTSKRTAPQWQPPVCFTRPSRSLEKQVIYFRPSVPHWLMYFPEYAIKGLQSNAVIKGINVCNYLRDYFYLGSKDKHPAAYIVFNVSLCSITLLVHNTVHDAGKIRLHIAYLLSLVTCAICVAPLTKCMVNWLLACRLQPNRFYVLSHALLQNIPYVDNITTACTTEQPL